MPISWSKVLKKIDSIFKRKERDDSEAREQLLDESEKTQNIIATGIYEFNYNNYSYIDLNIYFRWYASQS